MLQEIGHTGVTQFVATHGKRKAAGAAPRRSVPKGNAGQARKRAARSDDEKRMIRGASQALMDYVVDGAVLIFVSPALNSSIVLDLLF